jgi:tRNA-Thr(GGU) m(6)t(6)A37 methyltransferase TsaA
MNIEPIAFFRSPLTSKFGIPRQGGLASSLEGRIVLEPAYRHEEAVRGLEAFSHLWLIWEFSANSHESSGLTVRPPRLGGNERVGVFASRSPFRPNRLGLTSVEISRVDNDCANAPVIWVKGADLMDGTPIYDIKPYVAYADCHPEAKSGFVDKTEWKRLEVVVPEAIEKQFSTEDMEGLKEVLSFDPRPQYHDDPTRVYGMPFAGKDVRFRVIDERVEVVEIRPVRNSSGNK